MSKRLHEILSLISPGKGVVDVGTDHGYVPITLAESDYPGNLFATDIHSDPLNTAIALADEAGVRNRITFSLSDGLDGISPDEVDTIVIAGLGGDTICSVLDRAEWTMNPGYRMLLQPMTKGEVLRFWLCNNGYSIDSERAVRENGRIFRILCVSFSGENTPMTDAELYLGKAELLASDPLRENIAALEYERLQKKLYGLERSSRSSPEFAFFQNILHEISQWQR